MRIALFCPSYGQVGGIEEKVRVLIEAFRARGHAVTVLARGEPGTSSRDGDVPVVRSEYHQMPRRARHVVRQLRFLCERPRATRALHRAVTDAGSAPELDPGRSAVVVAGAMTYSLLSLADNVPGTFCSTHAQLAYAITAQR